jgi:hypothetical protein
MEPMRINVEEVWRRGRRGPWVARVYVLSCGRVGRSARAVIQMTIQLDEPQSGMSEAELKEQAREQALRFLDVA